MREPGRHAVFSRLSDSRVRREEEIRKRLALPETTLADGFLEVRESKLDLNREPHEVLVVTIEAR